MKNNIEKVYGKLPKKKVDLKKHKIALGLLDNFNYENEYLQDEVSRLSYSVEEWFDEKYDEMWSLFMDLKAVYLQNSESFVTTDDVAGDMEILNQVKTRAEELGIDVEEVYPEFYEHKENIEYLSDLEKRFDEQVRKMEDFVR